MGLEPRASLECEQSRFIEMERCPNFRDLGGYATTDGRRVRRRHLYRSMTPQYMTDRDVEIARGLGLGLIVDLRGRQADTSGPLASPPIRRLRVGHPRMLARSRAAMLEYANLKPEEALPVVLLRLGRAYAKAATAIAAEAAPSLVHCRLGKDRTGVFAAVVLSALGVSDDDILCDYMLSNVQLDACHQVLAEMEQPRSGAAESRVAREAPNQAAMQEVLRLISDHYGGGIAYLRFHGMRKRDVGALQERLLE
jgi:protein-tyrosine phosphatase